MNNLLNLKLRKILYRSFPYAFSLVSLILSIIPEKSFMFYKFFSSCSDETNIIINRFICCIFIFILTSILNGVYLIYWSTVSINGKGYTVEIRYGDLFKMNDCKKLINFDECFTTTIGVAPSEIKPSSVCGQYLTQYPTSDEDIDRLIDSVKLRPMTSKSAYNKKTRYESGRILPKEDYLLMAFAKLDKDGIGVLTYEEFIACLSTLWKEINKYYEYKNVCIPLLGAGVTRIGDTLLTQQELLTIIIESYKLSNYKIKQPQKLQIICRRNNGFSLLDIE